jgi:CheY-like chemotaxis protein
MEKLAFLVDDSKSARIVLSRLLKKNGFDQVEMAESGEEALEQLKNTTPDAIFVDFLMDGMDGLETINEIKKDPRFVSTPVVMCTANEGDEYVRAAVDHGALGILAKPPTDQSLGEIIDMIEKHQQEVEAKVAAEAAVPLVEEAPAAVQTPSEVPAAAQTPSEPPVAVAAGLSEADVRRIAAEVANQELAQIAARQAEQTAEGVLERLLSEKLDSAVAAYLDEHLKPLVADLVASRLEAVKPPQIDLDDLRSQVVQEINSGLEEFVRQLNQRTVEGLIEASIYEQITEVASDFSQRLHDSEQRILEQVPEKNEMINHIRVVTEGSLEALVQETATQVAQEISNSVATETVETLLDQRLAHQSSPEPDSKSSLGWLVGLLAVAAAGASAYFYLVT